MRREQFGIAALVIGATVAAFVVGATQFEMDWSFIMWVILAVGVVATITGWAWLSRGEEVTSPLPQRWPANRVFRMTLALALALGAAALMAASNFDERFQQCETTVSEPVTESTTEGDSTTVKTTDADNDGQVTTTVCKPIEAGRLAPILLVVGLLLLPDLSKLALGDLLTLEFKEAKEAAEAAKDEAVAAREAVNALTARVEQDITSSIENAVRQSVGEFRRVG